MVLQSSGAISLNDIQTEFGGTNPISISEYYDAATGVPASGTISFSHFYGKSAIVPGQQWYVSPGTYTFTVPSNITFVSAVAIGGGGGSSRANKYAAGWSTTGYGGGGGGGGGLAYGTFTVTPGDTITVVVGAGGSAGNTSVANGGAGGESYIYHNGNYMIRAYGGSGGVASTAATSSSGGSNYINTTYVTSSGGHVGGAGAYGALRGNGGGGGGTAGYTGTGGYGIPSTSLPQTSLGDGGKGGNSQGSGSTAGGGGGVGLLGSGVVDPTPYTGSGATGSGGNRGLSGIGGGLFGGGSSGYYYSTTAGLPGADGGVRIVWGEESRKYPSSTNIPDIIPDSDILLTSSYQSQLSTWGYTPDSIIYRSSIHGLTNRAFHALCDRFEKSIVVIKAANGYIFGGISVKGWRSTGYKNSPDTNPFVFNLYGNSSAPIKWNMNSTSNNIYTNPNYGPTFGSGHDIYTNLDTNTMYENDNSYGSASGYTGRVTGYTNSGTNRIVEVEVWSIT